MALTKLNNFMPTGSVLQMPFTQYTDTFTQSISANTDTVIGSAVLSVNITPKSTSSIIRLDAHIFHEWSNQHAAYNGVWFFYRDTTKLAHAQDGNRLSGISMSTLSYGSIEGTSTPEIASYSYFDSPNTTSQITYKIGHLNYGTYTLAVNRTSNDGNTTQYERGISFISATEKAG
tara:strand:+ start:2343 stop:2867 length:525 start_codon:yes stop_codon:yes gene_type:complete